MLSQKIISISEFKQNAPQVLASLEEQPIKYIVVNNKPKGVLVEVATFEKLEKMVLEKNKDSAFSKKYTK